MYTYKSEVITVAGQLSIAAQSKEEFVFVTFTDVTGSWTKEFFSVEDFKNYIKSLRITNMLRVSESGSTQSAPKVVTTKEVVKTKKLTKAEQRKELVHKFMAAKRGKANMHYVAAKTKELYAAQIKKYNNSKKLHLDSLSKELKISAFEVEMLAASLGHKLVHTVSGTYVQK